MSAIRGRDVEQEYREDLPEAIRAFGLLTAPISADAIALVPSSRTLSRPYADAIVDRFPLDLSQFFRKADGVRAADCNDFEQLVAAISYSGPRQDSLRSVVLVDDVFESGRSAAATILRLRGAGMPASATVSIAVGLRVFR
jgi:hypothetical protein